MRVLKKGFSTAEMLVTIMLFSFGILPLIVLFQNSHKQTAQAKNLMIAQSIGRSIIAEIRSLGFEVVHRDYKDAKYGYQHEDREVSGRLVEGDSESLEYPEYYKRFKTTLKFEPNDEGEPTKYRILLDVSWDEPDMRRSAIKSDRTFYLGFGTVVVKYGT